MSEKMAQLNEEVIKGQIKEAVWGGAEEALLEMCLAGDSVLMLLCFRLRHVAGTQWNNMNMKRLKAAPEEVSIAG